MFNSEFGLIDGDKWEAMCQYSFKRKYEEESYQYIPASPGDYGLEGFTRLTNKAFQCYCPERNYSASDLLDNQKKKITKDLNKLKTYESQIQNKIGKGNLIKQWFFVTPELRKNDIVDHCTKKTIDVKGWGLSIIDNTNFEVIAVDADFVRAYIKEFLEGGVNKVWLKGQSPSNDECLEWQQEENSLVDNAISKHRKRIPPGSTNASDKVNKLTNKTVEQFLEGKTIVDSWKKGYAEEYERFLKIVSQIESEVEEKCDLHFGDNNALYKEIKNEVWQRLRQNFKFLDDISITDVTNYVMSDWLLRCPINFEE